MVLIRVGQPQFTRAGDITRTRDKNQVRIKDKIDQLGRIFLGPNIERTRESSNTHPNQPRASSRVNNNQCVSFLKGKGEHLGKGCYKRLHSFIQTC